MCSSTLTMTRAVRVVKAKWSMIKMVKLIMIKSKDNIIAIIFIRRIDNLTRTNNWTDTDNYTNVTNTLGGFAHDWLFTTVQMLEWEGDQLTWTNLKPRFQWQFTTQSDDKHIIDGLSNLAMKPNESMGELLARIINTMVIIKESYAAYENKWMHLLTTAPISYTWRPLPPNGGMIP